MEIIYNLDTVNNRAVLALDVEGVPLAPIFLSFAEVGGLTAQCGDEFQVVTKETYKGTNPDVLAFFAVEPDDDYFGIWHSEEDKVTPILRHVHVAYINGIESLPYKIGAGGYHVFDNLWHQLWVSTSNRIDEISENVHEFVEECIDFLNYSLFKPLQVMGSDGDEPLTKNTTITATAGLYGSSIKDFIMYLDGDEQLQSINLFFETPEVVAPPLPITFSLSGAMVQTRITEVPTEKKFCWKISGAPFEELDTIVTPIQL